MFVLPHVEDGEDEDAQMMIMMGRDTETPTGIHGLVLIGS
jgi:hypothetical protein